MDVIGSLFVPGMMQPAPVVAVVIPCFRVAEHILSVLGQIGPECSRIYVVDDRCPQGTADLVEATCRDPRVTVLRHEVNQGVGGAMITGYLRAIDDGATVIVKIDGDGQMPPDLLPYFIAPILAGEADYTKGNRFHDLTAIDRMPRIRIFGNAVLSFMAKLSTGYWQSFDPTNGYTAIHAAVARNLPFDKISKRYFFETDMLFRLNISRAVVLDIPMDSHYGDEKSNLQVRKVLGEFLAKHARNFFKRLFYSYFLRDLSVASFQLVFGVLLLSFGLLFGGYHWIDSARTGVATPAGTVALAALPALLGIQLLLAFISYDVALLPRRALHRYMPLGSKADRPASHSTDPPAVHSKGEQVPIER